MKISSQDRVSRFFQRRFIYTFFPFHSLKKSESSFKRLQRAIQDNIPKVSWTIPIGRDALSFISQMQNWFPPRGILEKGEGERTRVPPSSELVIRGGNFLRLQTLLLGVRRGGERGASFRIWEKRSSFASLILTKGREGGKGGRSSPSSDKLAATPKTEPFSRNFSPP